jgi:hypothetical protein
MRDYHFQVLVVSLMGHPYRLPCMRIMAALQAQKTFEKSQAAKRVAKTLLALVPDQHRPVTSGHRRLHHTLTWSACAPSSARFVCAASAELKAIVHVRRPVLSALQVLLAASTLLNIRCCGCP